MAAYQDSKEREEYKMNFQFSVPGAPRGQPRPRFARVGKFVRTYDPKEAVEYKNRIALCAMEAGAKPIQGPVYIGIVAYLPRPRRLYRQKDNEGIVVAECKPDCDNIGKAVCDALNGICYSDDSHIVSLYVEKNYHEKAGMPRTEITINSKKQQS